MPKIIVGAQVSIDGVMQAPGGPTEDPTNGFRFGGWGIVFFDPDFGEIPRMFDDRFALLLGRKTYETFAAYWPYQSETGALGEIAKKLNGATKYVVSRSGEVDTGWAPTVLVRDLAQVRRLKQADGPDLLTQGSTELVHALLAEDLVDALRIFTMPVVLGGGKKLFADGSAPHSFRLTRSRASKTGVIASHYERDGEVKTANAVSGAPSERELARRERIKREG